MTSGPTKRHSFGYDLFSLIGPEMVRGSVILSAFANKELPWAQATSACSICCETAAKVSLSLRTFSERTGEEITRLIGGSQQSLHDFVGALVHHREIEIFLDPPLLARSPSSEWIDIEKQTRHRLTNLAVKSDRKTLEVPLADFCASVADEINHQLNSPEGRKIKKESKWQSS